MNVRRQTHNKRWESISVEALTAGDTIGASIGIEAQTLLRRRFFLNPSAGNTFQLTPRTPHDGARRCDCTKCCEIDPSRATA